jgi:hypothetical protein
LMVTMAALSWASVVTTIVPPTFAFVETATCSSLG